MNNLINKLLNKLGFVSKSQHARVVEQWSIFCKALGEKAKEKGVNVVFDGEYSEQSETGENYIFVLGSSNCVYGYRMQDVTMAPSCQNNVFLGSERIDYK